MLTVGLLFHSSNSDNLGVGALTVSQVEILRSIARATGIEISITLFDWVGPRTPYIEGADISITPLSGEIMKDPRRVIAMFRTCDLIVDIGAGDSFTDIYGPKRLQRMIYLKYLAHLARRPVVLAPQTFGPFSSWLTRPFARDLLRRATLIATRDDISTSTLRKLGVTRPITTASDVALRLPPIGGKPVWARPTIGLNVSGLLMAGGYTGKNQFHLKDDYPSVMRTLIARLLALPNRPEVVLVPHVISPTVPQEDDMAAALNLQKEFPEVIAAPAFQSPGQAKAYISSMDFFAGARMHACIAAFSSDVPVVPLAYSGKFAGMFNSLGYEATAECRTLDLEGLVSAVVNGYQQRDILKRQVMVARHMGEDRLREYSDALASVISGVALRKRSEGQNMLKAGPRLRALDERL